MCLSRVWSGVAGFSPLGLEVKSGDHTGYRVPSVFCTFIIIITVFASRYIAMRAGFFLKLSIKY